MLETSDLEPKTWPPLLPVKRYRIGLHDNLLHLQQRESLQRLTPSANGLPNLWRCVSNAWRSRPYSREDLLMSLSIGLLQLDRREI